jgi:hypothetical protein
MKTKVTNWEAAQNAAKENVVARPQNPTKTTHFSPAQFAKLTAAIEKAYPDLKPDTAAVSAAGIGKDGLSVKMAVYARPKAGGIPGANVNLYRSGSAVWTNVEPIVL